MLGLPPLARAYVLAVVGLGLALLAWAVPVVADWPTTVQLAVVFVVCDSLYARLASVGVALGSVVVLAALPLAGLPGAVLIAATGSLAFNGRVALVKRLFNGMQLAVAAGAAGAAYVALGGPVDGLDASDFPAAIGPIVVADVLLAVVNGLLVALVIALAERRALRDIWHDGMARSAVAYLGYGLFGLLLAVLWRSAGLVAAPLLLVPLFVARWAYAQYVREQAAYDATVGALVQAVETKDYYTRGHSERVARASVLIAREAGMREDRVASLRYAGILHDVGKLGVPTRVLQKSEPLSPEEYAAVQLHPVRGLEVVHDIAFLDEARAGILHHHERLDGRGYPLGLAGAEIPEFARIIAVADAFDSMTSTRSYRGARDVPAALAELRRYAGTQFDPTMVAALERAVAGHGWTPQAVPAPPSTEPVAAYDDDDPTAPPRIAGTAAEGAERS